MFDELATTFIASFLIWAMIFCLVPLWYQKQKGSREMVVHAVFSMLLTWVVAGLIKELFPIPRPFQLNGYPTLTLTIPFSSAFPSVHSSVAFALATSIYWHKRRLGVLFLMGAVLVALGRYLGNVHFRLDLLGGALLGTAVSIVVSRIHLEKITKKVGFRY